MQGNTSVINEQIHSLAHQLLDPHQPEKREARARLISLVYERVDAAVQHSLIDRHQRDPRDHLDLQSRITMNFFEKLCSRRFLEHLAQSEKPLAFITTSAMNLATDYLRSHPCFETKLVGRENNLQANDPLDMLAGDEPDSQQYLETVESFAKALKLVADLQIDQRILLKVVCANVMELEEEEIAHLARKRGIPAPALREEIARRSSGIDERFTEIERALERSRHQMLMLERTIYKVQRVIEESGDDDVAVTEEPLEENDPGRMKGSMSYLRSTSPGKRAAYLSLLQRQLEDTAVRMRELRKKLRTGLPPQPGWAEVARILGELPENATEQETRRKENTVMVRFRRLRQRLWEALRAGGEVAGEAE